MFVSAEDPAMRAPNPLADFPTELSLLLVQQVVPLLQMSEEEMQAQETARAYLGKLAKEEFRGAELRPFGSRVNGTALVGADMDLCFVPASALMSASDISEVSRGKAQDVVRQYGRCIRRRSHFQVELILHARVPIIRLTLPRCSMHPNGLKADISMTNRLALINSRLIAEYMATDIRAKQLAILVKAWARNRKVNSSRDNSLNSYGYCLMVIHYLVNIADPPVLPNLQLLSRQSATTPTDPDQWQQDLSYISSSELPSRGWTKSDNTQSIAELFIGFFRYYLDEFDYATQVVSIRTEGGILSKVSKAWQAVEGTGSQVVHCLSIEDPFCEFNVGKTVSTAGLYTIIHEMGRTVDILSSAEKQFLNDTDGRAALKERLLNALEIKSPNEPELLSCQTWFRDLFRAMKVAKTDIAPLAARSDARERADGPTDSGEETEGFVDAVARTSIVDEEHDIIAVDSARQGVNGNGEANSQSYSMQQIYQDEMRRRQYLHDLERVNTQFQISSGLAPPVLTPKVPANEVQINGMSILEREVERIKALTLTDAMPLAAHGSRPGQAQHPLIQPQDAHTFPGNTFVSAVAQYQRQKPASRPSHPNYQPFLGHRVYPNGFSPAMNGTVATARGPSWSLGSQRDFPPLGR